MIASRRSLRTVVGVLVVALAGLVAVQVVLLRQAWELEAQAFRRNVRSALALTVQQLDAEEIARGATEIVMNVPHADSTGLKFTMLTERDGTLTAGRGDSLSCVAEIDTLLAIVGHPDSVRHAELFATRLTEREDGEISTHSFTVTVEGDRQRLIRRVVSGMIAAEAPPIADRLAAAPLDSVLASQLAAAGIGVVPDVAVLAEADGSVVRLPAGADPARFASSPLRARLFGLDFAPPFYDLVLHFPGERTWLLRRTAPLLAASLLFLAVVIGGFVHTVRTLLEQRRYAAQVVGFVNNMTHEFKTPLSTLTLAAEAIARGATPRDESLQRHTSMIREETARMSLQVEKILQIAQLERGELVLNTAPLDGNRLVAAAAETFSLRVQERGGMLVCRPDAPRAVLRGDEVHLTNVLANLLDNALKYSPAAPDITLTTTNRDGRFVVTVADRGLGVPRADRERVFEPYYRRPTGNRHDVKGYGLGLSYVRLLAAAHGGDVALEANPGGGTRVILRLPLDGEEADT